MSVSGARSGHSRCAEGDDVGVRYLGRTEVKIRFDGVRQLQMMDEPCTIGTYDCMYLEWMEGLTRGGNVYQAQKATTVRRLVSTLFRCPCDFTRAMAMNDKRGTD